MVSKNDRTSATANQSGDEPEGLELKRKIKEEEEALVIHQADVGQEEIVSEVQEGLGTSRVSDLMEDEMHAGHIADIFKHQDAQDWDGEDPFAGVDGEGQEGVKSFRTAGIEGDNFDTDDFDTIFDDETGDLSVEDTQLVQTERADLLEAEEEERENEGRHLYRDEHNFDSGGLADGTGLIGPEDGIERQA